MFIRWIDERLLKASKEYIAKWQMITVRIIIKQKYAHAVTTGVIPLAFRSPSGFINVRHKAATQREAFFPSDKPYRKIYRI